MMWYSSLYMCYVMITCSTGTHQDISQGTFWQVSDFHYDSQYSVSGDPSKMCHKQITKGSSDLGQLGNYKCDSPLTLVKSAISAMKKFQPNPDFILWTGDSVPHITNSELSVDKVYGLIKTVTDSLVDVFPNSTIHPVFGNHDPYPTNQMPYSTFQYYHDVATKSGWDKLLNKEMMSTFLKGGYFSSMIKFGLRLVALNTPLYYHSNKLTDNIPDPTGQLAWLDNILKEARKLKQKVYLVGHIPPGTFARVRNIGWFYPKFNKAYLDILVKYQDVIVGQFYGHEHTDSFRVIYDSKGAPIGSMFVSPAVTPWNSSLAGAGYNNPSVRLYTYNRDNGQISDYIQYYLNLTEANNSTNGTWSVEYQLSKAFGLTDASPQSMHSLLQKINSSVDAFKKYLMYNSVSVHEGETCDSLCHANHICSIRHVDYDEYQKCFQPSVMTTHHTKMHTRIHSVTTPTNTSNDPATTDNHHRPSTTTPHTKRHTHVHSVTIPTNTLPPGGASNDPGTTDHHHHHHRPIRHPFPKYMYYVIGGLAGIVIMLFVVIACLCMKQKRMLGQPRYYRNLMIN